MNPMILCEECEKAFSSGGGGGGSATTSSLFMRDGPSYVTTARKVILEKAHCSTITG